MKRRNRQGRRLPIVTIRLAVVSFLFLLAILGPEGAGSGFAQNRKTAPPEPPSPRAAPVPPHVPGIRAARPGREDRDERPLPNEEATEQPTVANKVATSESVSTLLPLPMTASLEELSLRRNLLNQVLHRDRRHQLLLHRGEELLSRGDFRSAVDYFQTLIEAEHDAFYWDEGSRHPLSAQSAGYQRLRTLSPAARRTCELLHGDQARSLLREFIDERNETALLSLVSRYPHTEAGRLGLVHALMQAYDTGRYNRCAEIASRLDADLNHWRHLSPDLQSLVHRVLESRCATADSSTNSQAVSRPALRPAWTVSFRDNLSNPVSHEQSGDAATQIAETLKDEIQESFSEWLDERRERRFPVATANEVLVVGDRVLVRDFAGLRMLNLADGQTVWHFPCQQSIAARAARRLQIESEGGNPPGLSFHSCFAGNGPAGQLRSDGNSVFLLDESDIGGSDANDARHRTNRLLSIPLQSLSPEPSWILPAATEAANSRSSCFLGPPLVVDGRLYILTETDARLECVSLNALTGTTYWRQPIALAEQPIDRDIVRQRIASVPEYAAGTVVCPTGVGIVVGVDPLTGTLRWIYDHIDEDQRPATSRWSARSNRNLGSSELPSRFLTCGDRIFYLPFRSQWIHCIDASTGRGLWKTKRDGLLALSTLHGSVVIVIGEREVTALSAVDGSVVWKTPCPEPAGHGLVAGEQFLLPLTDGRCLTISLTSGQIQGTRFSKMLNQIAHECLPANCPDHEMDGSEESLLRLGGNLHASEEMILVSTPAGVAAMPQAASRLADFERASSGRSLAPQEQLQLSMLHLLLNAPAAAGASLESLINRDCPPHVKQGAIQLYREMLFARLDEASDPTPTIERIAQLPGTESDHIRLLVRRIDCALKLRDCPRLVAAVDELQQLNWQMLISPHGDSSLKVKARDYVAERMNRVNSVGPVDVRETLQNYLTESSLRVRESPELARQLLLIELFSDWPQVAGLKNHVAGGCLENGRLQQAELLLLENSSTAKAEEAALAHRRLVELYVSQEMYEEAVTHLAALDGEFHEMDVDGVKAKDFVDRFPEVYPLRAAIRRRTSNVSPPHFVQIVEHLCDERCGSAQNCSSTRVAEYHERIRRKFIATEDSSVTVIDRGIVTADRHSRLTLINRESGRLHGEFDVPAAYWQLAAGSDGSCGKLLPICGRAAHGLSLLEQRPIWSTSDADTDRGREKVKVGPVGYDYCVLQTPRRLSVIHPATGELRWSREDLSPDCGLWSNEATGIIGDRHTLILFADDQVAYRVYHMKSGEFVRTGRLPITAADARRHRRAAGTTLVHLARDEEGDRLRLWDTTSDRIVFDEGIRENLFTPIGNCREYAYVDRNNELVVIDVESRSERLRLRLPEADLNHVADLRVVRTPSQYLVNLVDCREENSGQSVAAMDELELPSLRVKGQLLAVSEVGELNWSKRVSDAALMVHRRNNLPILTLFSRVRDPQRRRSPSLRVDVLDARSGELLAHRDDLHRTRIVHASYRPEDGILSLTALDSRIDIEFERRSEMFEIRAEANLRPKHR